MYQDSNESTVVVPTGVEPRRVWSFGDGVNPMIGWTCSECGVIEHEMPESDAIWSWHVSLCTGNPVNR